MKLAWCGLILIAACHGKSLPPAAGTGSAGSAEVAGSAASAGSAAPAGNVGQTGSAAPAAPAGGAAPTAEAAGSSAPTAEAAGGSAAVPPAGPQVAALDDLDRWLAPIYKLDVRARYKAMCAAGFTLEKKELALASMGAPAGVDAKAWEDATTLLHGEIGGTRLCCKDDMKAYDKFPEALKVAADEGHNDCMKGTPDALAAVIKLVPGAKPFGTHANDPLMKSGSR